MEPGGCRHLCNVWIAKNAAQLQDRLIEALQTFMDLPTSLQSQCLPKTSDFINQLDSVITCIARLANFFANINITHSRDFRLESINSLLI